MPLARSREGRMFCCACQADVVPAGSARGARPNAATGRTATGGTRAPPNSNSETPLTPESRANASAGTVVAVRGGTGGSGCGTTQSTALSVSAALGEKLLQGWTLLDRTCRMCSTPLLRSSTGALLCVQCVGANNGSRVASGTQPPAVTAPATRAHLMPPPRMSSPRTSMPCALLPAPPVSGATPAVAPGTAPVLDVGGGDNTFVELCAAEAAVVATMATLRSGLAARRDIEGITAVLRAIREAAATVEQLRKARACVLASN